MSEGRRRSRKALEIGLMYVQKHTGSHGFHACVCRRQLRSDMTNFTWGKCGLHRGDFDELGVQEADPGHVLDNRLGAGGSNWITPTSTECRLFAGRTQAVTLFALACNNTAALSMVCERAQINWRTKQISIRGHLLHQAVSCPRASQANELMA